MFKKIACYSAAIFLVLTSFVLPSYASSDFSDQPLPYISSSQPSNTSGMLYAGTYNITSSGRPAQLYLGIFGNESDCYAFVVNNDVYVVSEQNVSSICFYGVEISDGYIFKNYTTIPSSNLLNYFYYVYNTYDNSPNFNLPVFNSLESGINAVNDYIVNGGISSSYSDTIKINPGQVAYIGFPASADYSIDVTTTMPKLSSGGGWSDSPQRWGATVELPSSGTSFPVSGSSQIPWNVVGSTNIFGQGVSAEWSVSNTLPVGYRFIYIYNPWYYQQSISSPSIYSSDGNLTINTNPITVTVEGYSAIRIFNLQQSVTGEGIYVSNSLSGFSDYTEVVPSSESGSGEVEYQPYVNGESSGDPSIINGTNNNQYNPNPMTVTEHIQQVTQVLSNFANSLIELIKAPISHVANLIQAGTGFMSSLRGLYAWLPVDIQGLVTSALTLVIGIGVFKVFL